MNKAIKILLATDCSESIMNAERYAVQFARNRNAHLLVLFVFEPALASSIPLFDPDKMDYDPGRIELRKLKERMQELVQTMGAQSDGLDYECLVREGDISEEIHEQARESGVDMIITGTHDAGKFRELFLGSHTWQVMKKTQTPVLAIPEDALFEPIRNIVFATEYRNEEIPVIQSLVLMAEVFDASFTVLHVSNYSLSKSLESILFDQFKNELMERISFYEKLKVSLIHAEDLVEGLNKYCSGKQVDWLAICSEKSSLANTLFNTGSSLSRRLSFHTRIPLLVIPDNYQAREWGLLEHIEKSEKK